MKQNVKKLLALLLVLLMVFSLAACRRQSSKTDETTASSEKTDGDIAPEDTSEIAEPGSDEGQDVQVTDPEEEKDEDSQPDDKNVDVPDEESDLIGVWTADVSAGAFLNSVREKMDTDLLKYLEFDEIMVRVQLTLRKDFSYTLEIDEDALEKTKENIVHTLRIGVPNILLDLSNYSDEEILEILKQRGMDIEKELGGKLEGKFWFEDGKLYYSIDTSDVNLDNFAVIKIDVGEFTVVEMSEDGQIHIDKAFLPIIFSKG